jgi:uncharacterized membrane protein YgcG
LSHKKLYKLVYVNYNLRLRLEEVSNWRDEGDLHDQLAHLSFYDDNNPLREWMEYGRSNRDPVLDEDDDDGDVPIPSQLVRDHINISDLCDATGDECISDWAHRHVGDTHIGKRRLQSGPTKGDPKRQRAGKAKPVNSDTSTDHGEVECSSLYQETEDSSSDDGDGDGEGDGACGGGGGGSNGGGGILFTGIHWTYICTHVKCY